MTICDAAEPVPQAQLDAAIDPECGILAEVTLSPPAPGDPHAYVAYTGCVARTARLGPWQADPVSLGTSFGDPVAARNAAIGEALERYCGSFVSADALERASVAELRAAGRRYLDLRDTVLFAPHQYARPGFPCVPPDETLRLLWTTGYDAEGPILVPGSLVWVNWWDGPRLQEPRTNAVPLAGLAAGSGMTHAVRSALYEVIERDAVALWWHEGRQAQEISLAGLAAELVGLAPELQLRLLDLPSDTGIPVVVAIIDDTATGHVVLGAAARDTRLAAAQKAILEALHMRHIAADLCNPDGVHWQAARAGEISGGITRSYRADRHYFDEFANDFSDVYDLGQHGLLLIDPRYRALWSPRIAARISAAEPLRLDAPQALAADLAADPRAVLDAHGYQTIIVDLTTPDVAELGVRVVRAIVPGLIPNAPAGLSYLGSSRYSLPATALDTTPMPHV